MSTKNAMNAPPISSFLRKWRIDSRERLSEWYRAYFHTIFVTGMIVVNLVFAYSALIIYLSRWKHHPGNAAIVLSYFFDDPPVVLANVLNFFLIPFDTWHWAWILLVINLPLMNWLYSTVTQPIKKGYTTIISWTSERGRIWACILSAIPFALMYCAITAWYVDEQLFEFFVGIASDKAHLVVKSMASFGYLLMVLPVFLVVIGTGLVLRQFYIFEDLQKQFMTWEFPLLSSQSFSLKNDNCDVIVGWEKKTKKPIVLSEGSRFLHELISGATGTGKTSTTILMRITQDLIRIARGKKLSVVALEPKGDMVRDVLKIAKKLGIPDEKIKVVDPTNLARSIKFNPFVGPMETAAGTFRGVLNALTGNQDEFFKGQQEETATLYTLLGKLRYGNIFNIHHIQRMYADARYLADIVESVRRSIDRGKGQPDLTDEERRIYEGYERIVSYFEDDVLDYKTWKNKEQEIQPVLYPENHRYAGRQVVESKKDKYVSGAKKYLNDLAMNQMLSQLMIAKEGEEALDLDKFLEEGGILLVNTALGELEELSVLFGQFFIRQLQSAVFRRPSEEEEKRDENGVVLTDNEGIPIYYERIPTFFTIDEFPLFINESFERMLTLGRSYRVSSLIAIQSLGQLQKVIPGYDRVILGNARNKTVFGGGEYEDNEAFSKQFGEEYQIEESLNESSTPVTMPGQRWDYRYNTQRKLMARFSPTDIMELKFKHFICQFVDPEGSIQPPLEGIGKFVNETRFLRKFVNIGAIELETKKYKPLSAYEQFSVYKSLIAQALINRQDVEDEAASADEKPPEKVESADKPVVLPPTNDAGEEEKYLEGTTGGDNANGLPISEQTEEGDPEQHNPTESTTDSTDNNPVDKDDDAEKDRADPALNEGPRGLPSILSGLAFSGDDDEEEGDVVSPANGSAEEARTITPPGPAAEPAPLPAEDQLTSSPTTPASTNDRVSVMDDVAEKHVEELLKQVQEFALQKNPPDLTEAAVNTNPEAEPDECPDNRKEEFDWTVDDIPDLVDEGKEKRKSNTTAKRTLQVIVGEEEDDI